MAAIGEFLNIVLAGRDLGFDQARAALDAIFAGEVPDVQVAALLAALRTKGVTAPEIAGLATSLRSHANTVQVGIRDLVDTCGTGGGAVKTCNVSTGAALVAAGAGVYVAKHGNRGITSKCGSADVLEALGVKIDPGPDVAARCIREAHIGFLFAPAFHPAMRLVQPIRKALGFRTVFNLLGPLANPAGANRQVMGVADGVLMDTIVQALKILGTHHALVVHSSGLDEISTAGPTRVVELKEGVISAGHLDPADLGLQEAKLEDLRIETAQESAQALRAILEQRLAGPKRDIVVLNAAAAILVGGLAGSLQTGMLLADQSIREGKALACLETLIRVSNR
ncbi:MAG: anthranilate phosphoribosyltransferase [Phycisphaerae bacterium]|nr:anthranilate phosphoribosyltransferase [Phycisphaerae bacterium]